MTSETQRLNNARHKNRKASSAPPVHPAFVLQHQRGSEASIREKQSVSVALAKRTGKRQPSMPKFNLKED